MSKKKNCFIPLQFPEAKAFNSVQGTTSIAAFAGENPLKASANVLETANNAYFAVSIKAIHTSIKAIYVYQGKIENYQDNTYK